MNTFQDSKRVKVRNLPFRLLFMLQYMEVGEWYKREMGRWEINSGAFGRRLNTTNHRIREAMVYLESIGCLKNVRVRHGWVEFSFDTNELFRERVGHSIDKGWTFEVSE